MTAPATLSMEQLMIEQFPHPVLCHAGTSSPVPAFRLRGEKEIFLTRSAAEFVIECRAAVAASRKARGK